MQITDRYATYKWVSYVLKFGIFLLILFLLSLSDVLNIVVEPFINKYYDRQVKIPLRNSLAIPLTFDPPLLIRSESLNSPPAERYMILPR